MYYKLLIVETKRSGRNIIEDMRTEDIDTLERWHQKTSVSYNIHQIECYCRKNKSDNWKRI